MEFDLSDEQRMLQESIRGFLESECPPARRREIFDAPDAADAPLWKGLMELGLGGIHLPEEHGGTGLGALDLACAAETLGHEAAPGPFLGHALAGAAIALAGSPAQQAHWLPRLATGDVLASVALAEGAGCWQPEQWCLPEASRIRGEKHFVPAGGRADVVVVGTAGGGLMLVEVGEGTRATPFDGADRTRRLDSLRFDDAPAEALPKGREAAPRVRDLALVLLAADAFGGASRCVELSVEHAGTREQFGVTIGHFQALKHQLANMALEVEPARALYWYAAHAWDAIPDEAARSAALAKAHLGDRFMQVARDTVEAHGGIGFTWECDVQIWFKRAMFDRAFMGTPDFHRERAAQMAGWVAQE